MCIRDSGSTAAKRPAALAGPVARTTGQGAPAPGEPGATDPYAELKTRIHHAVIAKLGPELFKRESAEDLSERVLHAVTEQLALEPLLRDDSVSEVMVNSHDRIFVEREGRLERELLGDRVQDALREILGRLALE